MKTSLLFILLLFLNLEAYSKDATNYVGDLLFNNGSEHTIDLKVELVSIPFEGKTSPSVDPLNRFDLLYNGTKHRHFNQLGPIDFIIPYLIQKDNCGPGLCLDMSSTTGIEPQQTPTDGLWALGIYKFTVHVDDLDELFIFYWNCLDSKYNKPNFHGEEYYRDWQFEYDDNEEQGGRIIITAEGPYEYFDYIEEYDPLNGIPEISPWDLLYERSEPWEEIFYVRTTPFGVWPSIAQNNNTRVFKIGTKIILDGVLENLGNNDNQGYNTYNFGDPLNYWENPPIPQPPCGLCTHENVYTTPGLVSINQIQQRPEGMKFIAESGDQITLTDQKRLYVTGVGDNIGDTLVFKPGSSIILGEEAEIGAVLGGVVIYEDPYINYSNNSCFISFANSTLDIRSNQTINNGALLVVEQDGVLKIADNVTITVEDSGGRLIFLPGSKIIMGNNSKIVVKNGAYLYADGTDFTSNGTWDGIYFENAGTSTQASTIKNCTFEDAKVPIKIYNTSTSTANNSIVIQNNTIQVPATGSYGIYADNANKLFIQGNNISTSTSNLKPCIYIKHPYSGDGLPGSGPSPEYDLKIVNNTFSNTNAAMILAGYTSALVPYYIAGNKDNGTALQGYGLIGRRITGTIKQNRMSTAGVRNFLIHQSNPAFYDNEIKSNVSANGRGLVLLSESSPILAPYTTGQQDLVWQGGYNKLEGKEFAMELNYANSVLLEDGQNTFKIGTSSNFYLYGAFTPIFPTLNAKNNCWEPSGASNNVWNSSGSVTVIMNPQSNSCGSITPLSSIVTDLGDGVFDTVWVTEGDAMPTPQDAILYGQANDYTSNGFHFDAISTYKSLIDSFPSSDYLFASLYDLYTSHETLDTFSLQEDRNIHFGALKTYLENKITSGNYDSKFEQDAYNIVLMCEGNMDNYDNQITGYQFLSLYHPDLESRLIASDDLAIVEDLLEGEGGGSTNLTAEQYAKKVKIKIDKLISSDPVLKSVKESYDNTKKENTKNLEKELKTKFGKEKAEIKMLKTRQLEERIDSRIRENMLLMRTLTNDEKEQRSLETMMIIASMDRNEITMDNPVSSSPFSYKLEQNYPNPFNPSTTISFSVPNDLIVKIKVYDITGREVKTLVNELKTAGQYSVSFNGNGLASGVYFYTINAGSFVETKRMVLVK